MKVTPKMAKVATCQSGHLGHLDATVVFSPWGYCDAT